MNHDEVTVSTIMLATITIVMGLITTCLSFGLGYNYIYTGYGLIPWIAFPLGFITTMVPAGYVLYLAIQSTDDELAELERKHFGDPDKWTGIYHPDVTDRAKPLIHHLRKRNTK